MLATLGGKRSEHWTQIPPGHSQSLQAPESQPLGFSTGGQGRQGGTLLSPLAWPQAWCPKERAQWAAHPASPRDLQGTLQMRKQVLSPSSRSGQGQFLGRWGPGLKRMPGPPPGDQDRSSPSSVPCSGLCRERPTPGNPCPALLRPLTPQTPRPPAALGLHTPRVRWPVARATYVRLVVGGSQGCPPASLPHLIHLIQQRPGPPDGPCPDSATHPLLGP